MGAESSQILDCLTAFKQRHLIVLWDDASPTKRAILVAPAEKVTPASVNEILHLGGGLLFVAVSQVRASAFMLSPMMRPRLAPEPLSEEGAPQFLVSVEAREGVTTGISAADRALTVSILGEREPQARKLVSPGHIFPVQVRDGGVLVKQALAEGALDLTKICGFGDAALFTDILGSNGGFTDIEKVRDMIREREVPLMSLGDLTRYRLEHESLVSRVAETKIPTHEAGELRSIVYKSEIHDGEHIALIKGDIISDEPVLTRVQPEFTFGDVFGGNNPPSRFQLQAALRAIGKRGKGVLIYLRRPLVGELRAQVETWDVKYREKPAQMMREYGLGAQILRDLGVRKIEVLTGSARKLVGLTTFGIEIVAQQALER